MTTRASVLAYSGASSLRRDDALSEEEPLEIQVGGVPIAVVMRTPGHDAELAVGFLVTERVVHEARDVVSARHCSTVRDPESEENVMRIVLREGIDPPLEQLRRNTYASSSCGVCGKASIESVMATGGPISRGDVTTTAVLYGLPDELRRAQRGFDATGGLHAAGLFDTGGKMLLVREDVGRHNAVDKVVGAHVLASGSFDDTILLVSGRISFEIVQKAAAARIALVAGISAPTSLAVRAADALAITVVGFLRGETMNVYTRPERVLAPRRDESP
ncbi:MAG: formate dehydrogenase accessory sulfurtransferase FdhD [Polyangiaceae bacterium]|nr:formate dehydrogenase accessory sulfurtransferase FdhD [Polyangiaceae bacterium]